MSRLPFDPNKMAVRKEPPQAPAILTVSQLSQKLDSVLRDGLTSAIRVSGEISGFRDRTHWYFDLKDADSVISCVMFQSAARRSSIQPADGLQVVIKGRIEYYAKQGKVSLLAESIEPIGAGALDLAFRKLVDECRALGWLDPNRKRLLPRFPRRIAIVTSRTGAALQDVLVTMKRRCPAVSALIVDVRVQGDAAAAEITAAIRELSIRGNELNLDAIILTRGGGSKEDLWSFNDRQLAESIVNSPIPIVAAIGHETDTTLAELVADERCATPTQAAMRLTPDAAELARQVESLDRRLNSHIRRLTATGRRSIDTLAARPALRDPMTIIEDRRELLESHTANLCSAAMRCIRDRTSNLNLLAAKLDRHRPQAIHAGKRSLLETLARRLEVATRARTGEVDLTERTDRLALALRNIHKSATARIDSTDRQLRAISPLRVLDRGFSVTTTPDGRIIRSTLNVQPGDQITTRVADGQFTSITQPNDGSPTPPRSQPTPAPPPPVSLPRRPSSKKPTNNQEGLFGTP